MKKRIFILAGPNGAGKTTTAQAFVPDLLNIYEFINADEIARGLAPLNPESVSLAASKLMIKRLRELLASEKSFAFETTAAGTNYLKYLKEAQTLKYQINLVFLWLSSPELAIKRVASRVSHGGHHVPEETIRRRYLAGIKNLIKYYLPVADSFIILDNSPSESQKIIAEGTKQHIKIEDVDLWEKIKGSFDG